MNKMGFLIALFLTFAPIANADKGVKKNWYRAFSDTAKGIALDEATAYIKARKMKMKKPVIVGIIDSGIDTTVTDLKSTLWTNPKEKAGDGKDNDRNGYTDDIHGWNFLGTADGSFNMTSAGTEEFRQFKRLYPQYKNLTRETAANKTEFDFYERMKKKAGISGYMRMYGFQAERMKTVMTMDSIVKQRTKADTLTIAGVMHSTWQDSLWLQAAQANYVQLMKSPGSMTWTDFVKKQHADTRLMRKRLEGIEKDADKRLLMGDDIDNFADRFYGNAQLMAEGCYHGTFVAGVVAGQGFKEPDLRGVFPQAKIMVLRAAPDGDEYDKDVATAIRYAVDNGAKVVNISLGKYTSPHPDEVSEAIAYAAKKDVLIVHAAGNNHLDIDRQDYFPTGKDADGRFFDNFLRVGAAAQDASCSSLSNYGKTEVHLFAPGENITAVTEGGVYATENGTSLAAPIVSGVAALLRSYFPKLKAQDICHILMKSVEPMKDAGKCISQGVVNVLKAVKMAQNYQPDKR